MQKRLEFIQNETERLDKMVKSMENKQETKHGRSKSCRRSCRRSPLNRNFNRPTTGRRIDTTYRVTRVRNRENTRVQLYAVLSVTHTKDLTTYDARFAKTAPRDDYARVEKTPPAFVTAICAPHRAS